MIRDFTKPVWQKYIHDGTVARNMDYAVVNLYDVVYMRLFAIRRNMHECKDLVEFTGRFRTPLSQKQALKLQQYVENERQIVGPVFDFTNSIQTDYIPAAKEDPELREAIHALIETHLEFCVN